MTDKKQKPQMTKINLGEERKKKAKEERERIEQEWKESGIAFPSFTYWPYHQWKIWEADCEKVHGNNRQAKAMHDHMVAKNHEWQEGIWQLLIEQKQRIDELEKAIALLSGKDTEETEEGVKTFGGMQHG